MPKVTPEPVSVDIDFTDTQLTGQGGLAFLAQLAPESGLLDQFAQRIRLKQRRRASSDAEMVWSLVASLASGNGALSDLDALCQDPATARLLGIDTFRRDGASVNT
ncbi:transposase [Halomonas sp. NO4]|uniref:transposase n=1 Tax=Halomonas sp. NO4 TaxID=2484813 RepID=UPI0013D475EA|nr:transposase [Halomonas sp. NO4]